MTLMVTKQQPHLSTGKKGTRSIQVLLHIQPSGGCG